MVTPDWDINVYDGDVYGTEAQRGQAVIAIYDRSVSTSEPVHRESFNPAIEIDEDTWLTPDELEAKGSEFFGNAGAQSVRNAFATAESKHREWLNARAARAAGGQGRVAAGVPSGGQFAAVDRPESAVTLGPAVASAPPPANVAASDYPSTDRVKPLADAARTIELNAAIDDIAGTVRQHFPAATAIKLEYQEATQSWNFESLLNGDEEITPTPWMGSEDEALWKTEGHIRPLLRFVVSGNDDLATSGLASIAPGPQPPRGKRDYTIQLDPTVGVRPRADVVSTAMADALAVLETAIERNPE